MAETKSTLTPEEYQSLSKSTQAKIKIINSQKTVTLVERLDQLESEYEKAVRNATDNKNANTTFIANMGSDSQAVKEFMAGLQCPELNESGKKTTVAEREAWLMKQRKDNPELLVLIERQKSAAFILEADRNQIDIMSHRIANVRAVLALRTAQLNFLSE